MERSEGLTSSGADAPPSPACAIQGEGKALGCETCRHHLGAGVCAVSLEMECRDGNYEAWEEKNGNGQNSMRDPGVIGDVHVQSVPQVHGQDGKGKA